MLTDPLFHQSLTIGPLTRYAEDLKLIANVIGGDEIRKLNLNEEVCFKILNRKRIL